MRREHWQGRDDEEAASFATGFLFEESLGKPSLISGYYVASDSSGIVYKRQSDRNPGNNFFVIFEVQEVFKRRAQCFFHPNRPKQG